MMFKIIFIILVFSYAAYGQHDHMEHEKNDTTKTDSMKTGDINSHLMHNHHMNMGMNGGVLLTDKMSQEGSGTSWTPASSQMHMAMYHSDNWMFMIHGGISLRYTKQGGPRGRDAFSSPNWLMASAQRMLGNDAQIMFRTMLSADRLSEGGDGYPLLFQTGETWKGSPLIDRQHPHDIFSELALSLSGRFSKSLSGYVYLGYPGEPALGPVVFMHRPSALSNPDATLSHHWQDATHVTFGVATLGISLNSIVKLEGSVFNGSEPDENRLNFDKPKFNSYSGRLSYNPINDISLQISAGFTKDPEGEGIDVVKRSASVLYSKKINSKSNIDISLIWGQNKDNYAGAQNSYLAEAEFYISGNSIYTRLENVEKTRHDLGIEDLPYTRELIGAYTLGYKRKILSFVGLDLNAGLQGTIYSTPNDLKDLYGKNPASYQLYISILPKH
ncbi:MAG TPA: hypothetical protein VGK25_13200 [Ignavibacteria bacterium]|jgi:hypothetical protein